jgi:hypothetical protein
VTTSPRASTRACANSYQEQAPHAYDSSRRYHPERETLPLLDNTENDEDEPISAPPAALTTQAIDTLTDDREDDAPLRERIRESLYTARIELASHANVLLGLERLEANPNRSPYKLSQDLGLDREQARRQPATGPHIQLRELLADDRSNEEPRNAQGPAFKL